MLLLSSPLRPVGPLPSPVHQKAGLTDLTGKTGKDGQDNFPILSLLTKPDNIASTVSAIICHHLVPPATHSFVLPRHSPLCVIHIPQHEDQLSSPAKVSVIFCLALEVAWPAGLIPRPAHPPSFLVLVGDTGALVDCKPYHAFRGLLSLGGHL